MTTITEQKKSKCIIYIRVSSKEQKESGFSPEAQLKLLKDYAEKGVFACVKTFEDIETAKRAGRENFEKMLEYLLNI